jgi:hypothetical protein
MTIPSIRALFLLVVACVFVFHLPYWGTILVLIGFEIAEDLDQRRAMKAAIKARWKIHEELMDGWEPSKDDPESEEKGDWTRVRLTGKDQILLTRIAELFVRMP